MKLTSPTTEIERVAAYLLRDELVVCSKCQKAITWRTADIEKRGASARVRRLCRDCRKDYQRKDKDDTQ